MKTLAKYHVCNQCVIGEKTFKNILIGPGKLPGLSRNGPQGRVVRKPVNANPGLKVNHSINFSCIKIFFTAFVF